MARMGKPHDHSFFMRFCEKNALWAGRVCPSVHLFACMIILAVGPN